LIFNNDNINIMKTDDSVIINEAKGGYFDED